MRQYSWGEYRVERLEALAVEGNTAMKGETQGGALRPGVWSAGREYTRAKVGGVGNPLVGERGRGSEA